MRMEELEWNRREQHGIEVSHVNGVAQCMQYNYFQYLLVTLLFLSTISFIFLLCVYLG